MIAIGKTIPPVKSTLRERNFIRFASLRFDSPKSSRFTRYQELLPVIDVNLFSKRKLKLSLPVVFIERHNSWLLFYTYCGTPGILISWSEQWPYCGSNVVGGKCCTRRYRKRPSEPHAVNVCFDVVYFHAAILLISIKRVSAFGTRLCKFYFLTLSDSCLHATRARYIIAMRA